MNSNTGFTLIETLIYSAILAIFLSGSLLFINSLLGSLDKLTADGEVVSNIDFVTQKLGWQLERSASVLDPLPNSSLTRLETESAIFELVGGNITLTYAGVTAPITNNRVVVKDFSVEHFSNEQSSSTLRIFIDIESRYNFWARATSTLFYIVK